MGALPLLGGVTALAQQTADTAVEALNPEGPESSSDANATYVRVDWSRVPNGVIRECSLEGLAGLVLQYLMEEGYAPVEGPGPGVINAEIAADEEGFSIVSSVGRGRQSERVAIDAECDSSIQFDVIRALLNTLEPLREEAQKQRLSLTPVGVALPEPDDDRMWFDFSVNAEWVGDGRPLIMLDAEASFAIGDSPVLLGVGLENAFMKYEGELWVTEPGVYTFADFRVNKGHHPPFYIGLEAAALAHIYRGPVRGEHADARFGARFRLELEDKPHFGLLVRVFGRLFSFKHLDGTDALYESTHWGVSIGGFFGFGR